MKKLINIFLIIGFSILIKPIYAQSEKDSTIIDVDNYYIDFSVPDLGAFTLLNTKPDYISTPGDPKEFAASLLNAIGNGRDIPSGIAIEWTPYKTISKTTTIENYYNTILLRRFQFTYGSLADSVETKVSAGFKFTILDKPDPLLDKSFRKQLAYLGEDDIVKIELLKQSLRDSFQDFLEGIRKKRKLEVKQDELEFSINKNINELVILKDSNQVKKELIANRDLIINTINKNLKELGYLLPKIKGDSIKKEDEILLKNFLKTDDFAKYQNALNESKNFRKELEEYFSFMVKTINSEIKRIDKNAKELTENEKTDLNFYCERIKCIQKDLDKYNVNLSAQLKELKQIWKEKNWNAPVLVVGGGWIGKSTNNSWDSLMQSYLKVYANFQCGINEKSKIVGLCTFEWPTNINYTDSTIVSQLFLGGRYLNGNSNNRFSIDFGYNLGVAQKPSFDTHTLLFCIGYEYKITDGLFFELVSGYKGPPSDFFRKPSFMASGNLKFALRPKQRFGSE